MRSEGRDPRGADSRMRGGTRHAVFLSAREGRGLWIEKLTDGGTWGVWLAAVLALLVTGLYILIQQVENNYLVPRIIGRSLNLHPLVVIVAVVAGANLGGVLGALLAAPTLASLRVLVGYTYRRLLDEPPFPAPVDQAKGTHENSNLDLLT